MNPRILVKTLVIFVVMTALGWGVSAPKKSSPYASAVQMVTVRSAHAACNKYCSAFLHGVCLTTTELKKCNNGGTYCQTLICVE